jgi:hypothetical protein
LAGKYITLRDTQEIRKKLATKRLAGYRPEGLYRNQADKFLL